MRAKPLEQVQTTLAIALTAGKVLILKYEPNKHLLYNLLDNLINRRVTLDNKLKLKFSLIQAIL